MTDKDRGRFHFLRRLRRRDAHPAIKLDATGVNLLDKVPRRGKTVIPQYEGTVSQNEAGHVVITFPTLDLTVSARTLDEALQAVREQVAGMYRINERAITVTVSSR